MNPFYRGVSFFQQDGEGDTQLHIAAVCNNIYWISKIVDCAWDTSLLNLQNIYGDSPLHLAARIGASEICKLLIKKGADPCLRNYTGDTSLHLVCMRDDIDCAFALMYRDMPGSDDSNAQQITPPQLEELKIHNYKGESCLHIALGREDCALVNALLLHGADIEAKLGTNGYRALHIAATSQMYDMVELLLRHWKADVHSTTYEGVTAYQLVSRMGDQRMADLLVRYGAFEELYSADDWSSEDED